VRESKRLSREQEGVWVPVRADGKQLCCRYWRSRREIGRLSPTQAKNSLSETGWQSPGRYQKKLPDMYVGLSEGRTSALRMAV
jgi:hypothetical protein